MSVQEEYNRMIEMEDNVGFDKYPLEDFDQIGKKDVRRLDGTEKASGRAEYTLPIQSEDRVRGRVEVHLESRFASVQSSRRVRSIGYVRRHAHDLAQRTIAALGVETDLPGAPERIDQPAGPVTLPGPLVGVIPTRGIGERVGGQPFEPVGVEIHQGYITACGEGEVTFGIEREEDKRRLV